MDARTVRRDAAFARAVRVIGEKMGVSFRDAILTREYTVTRKQVVEWARDFRTRKVSEDDIRRRVAEIVEERRRKAEGGTRTDAEADDSPADGDAPGDVPADDSPTWGTPLTRLYQAWDDLTAAWGLASDEDKAMFRAVPSVPELAAELLGEQAGEWPAGGRARR